MENLSYAPQIQHFSHPHPHTLQLFNLQDNPQLQQPSSLSVCLACQHPLSSGGAWIYSCPPCGFAVHASCAQLITHPSHPMHHPLSLLPYRATGAVAQPSLPQPPSQLQHNNSFPGATNSHWHQHPKQTAPATMGPTTQPGLPNHITHSYSMGAVPNSQPPSPLPTAAGRINSRTGSAIRFAVNLAANVASQTLVQVVLSSISGGNDNGNDGSGYDG